MPPYYMTFRYCIALLNKILHTYIRLSREEIEMLQSALAVAEKRWITQKEGVPVVALTEVRPSPKATVVMALGIREWCSLCEKTADELAKLFPFLPIRETTKTALKPFIEHANFLEGPKLRMVTTE